VTDAWMRVTGYMCSTGHSFAIDEFELLTEERTLDGGARVRICRAHGAPISMSAVAAEQEPARDHGVDGRPGSGPDSLNPDPVHV